VPSLPPLTRNRAVMWPLDAADRVINWPWRELRGLPPNRMRLRVGVQNRVLCNGFAFRTTGVAFWMGVLARGHARLDARVLDLGSGCGRFALPLRDHNFYGQRFAGHYLGVDIDTQMLEWCRRNFDARFDWHDAGKASATYRPAAQPAPPLRLPLEVASRDLALANSLFSHLLEPDFVEYVREGARVIRPGGWFYLTAFIRGHVEAGGRLGGRWTFGHRRGAAWIESERYPEAAVAYDEAWVRAALRQAGFGRIRMASTAAQTLVWCQRRV
jgi:SAM-dependent methyltransferase